MNINSPNHNNYHLPFTLDDITELLTCASRQLDADTVAALCQARHVALERLSTKKSISASNMGRSPYWLIPHSAHHWVATAILLVTIVFGVSYWHYAEEDNLTILDIAILTDELPLEIFVN